MKLKSEWLQERLQKYAANLPHFSLFFKFLWLGRGISLKIVSQWVFSHCHTNYHHVLDVLPFLNLRFKKLMPY